MAVKNWSTTPASNASVDSINFAEGQNPSTVNDSARQLMADVAELYALNKGGTVTGTIGGTGDAVTLATTPNPFSAAYATGQRFLMKMTAVNTVAAPTLNVASLGAKTIKMPGGVACAIPQWAINDVLTFVYDGTDMILVAGSSVASSGILAAAQALTRNAQTGTTYTVLTGDRAKYITFSNASAIAVTLPQANSTTFGGGWYTYMENIGAGTVTVTPTTSTINTLSTLTLETGQWALIESDNTNYRALIGGAIPLLPQTLTTQSEGFRAIPQNAQNTAYTFVLADAGKHIFHDEVTARVYTIPANATVAFPIGTVITIINNNGAGAITLSITTDTLRRGDGTAGTGSRTIGADRVASIIKTKSTEWVITGSFT